MKSRNIWIWIIALTLTFSGGAMAQEAEDEILYGAGAAFARLVATEGETTINRESSEKMDGAANLSIEPLDTLSTGWGGRAVVQFLDGSLLKLNEQSRVDFLEIGSMGEETQLTLLARLWEGNLFLDISDDENVPNRSFRLDTEDITLYFLSGGRYRIDKRQGETVLKVISGTVEVRNANGSTLYHAGEQALARTGYANVYKTYFNTFELDTFDTWAMNNYTRRATAGSEYVPEELRYYAADLDDNGTWYYDDNLTTYVWQPSVVVTDWSPYSNGYWSWSPWGMSWVSHYSWGWAPFHYGSWDWSIRFGWVWIPGRHYSPAWVSWCHWDNYMGWYPYNHHHWRRYHRGHVTRHHHRHHRLVYAHEDRFYHRNNRWARRDVPEGRGVTRVDRPIAPKRDQLTRSPREAVRQAVARPVNREVIRQQQTTVRKQTETRLNSRAERVTVTRGSGTSRESAIIRTPEIRSRDAATTSGRSNRTIQDRTVRPRVESRSSTSSGISGGKIIRRSPVETRSTTPRSTTIRNESNRPIINNTRSTTRTPTVQPRSSSSTRSTTVKPRTSTSSRSTAPSTAVKPRSSTSGSRATINSRSSSRSSTRNPVVSSNRSTVKPKSGSSSRTVTRSSSKTKVKSTSSRSSSRSSATRSSSSSSSSSRSTTTRKR